MQPGLGTYEYPLQAADARDYCLTDVCLNLTPQAAAQGGGRSMQSMTVLFVMVRTRHWS